MSGDAGDDKIYGSDGAEYIADHNGNDRLYGNGRDDIISANDGSASDFVDCGSGVNDSATVDKYVEINPDGSTLMRSDTVVNCENIFYL
ncbi:hypothetical protein GBA65_03410 [Rubrobacter marinus]|uniref:Hemolysin-type calcium-binding repeat-containing protein n=1 Tax=Rubrobacter marinus TaxID=2653852 RepID=A0A6G8PU43_9ACTN|nr:hypothetical protein [Rubrobacter marinus]QIN77717.1 hypothetical protein GBA65_03410 [Rubrobacter marinus]